MATMNPEEFVAQVRGGSVPTVVLFAGEEQLLADEAMEFLLGSVVDEGMKDFNMDVLEGTRTTVQDVLSRASAFPMMGERRVVVVRRFEKLVSTEASRDLFRTYLDNPSPTTVLVLAAERADLRKHPFRDIQKQHVLVDCKPLKERDVPAWLQGRATKLGKGLDGEAAFMLQSYVGSSLLSLLRELEKLVSYVGDRPDITKDDVADAVGATRGYTIFDLQDAIGSKNYKDAVSIVRRMMLYGQQAPLIIATITRYFMQLGAVQECVRKRMAQKDIATTLGIHPYRVKLMVPVVRTYPAEAIAGVFHTLRASDRRLKTTDTDSVAEMELMLHAIVRADAVRPTPHPVSHG